MRCKQFIIVSLAGVVLAASLASCGGAVPASSAVASSVAASSVMVSSAAAETALPDGVYTADFETDSSMFHPNEACNGKGTLTVENGVMTFHVSLASKKIVNLYPGLAADAEANKAEDHRRFELAQSRNQADAAVAQIRKTLKDLGDKVDGSDRAACESAIKDVEAAAKGEDKAAIDKSVEALMSAAQKIGEKMNAAAKAGEAQAQQQPRQPQAEEELAQRLDDLADRRGHQQPCDFGHAQGGDGPRRHRRERRGRELPHRGCYRGAHRHCDR